MPLDGNTTVDDLLLAYHELVRGKNGPERHQCEDYSHWVPEGYRGWAQRGGGQLRFEL